MKLRKPKSKLDQQIDDLERELRMVQADVKSLTRAVHDPRKKSLPRLRSVENEKAAQSILDERAEAGKPLPETRKIAGLPVPPKPDRPKQTGHVSPVAPASNFRSSAGGPQQDHRFATYLSAKGVNYSSTSSRKERNIQRNKAIAMVLIVILVLYVVIQLSR